MTGPNEHTREPTQSEPIPPGPAQADADADEVNTGQVCDPYGFPATAGRGVGGYMPARRPTPTAPVPREVNVLVEQQLAALNQTYPAWRITRVKRADGTPGGWWATRHRPLTDDQRAAGLVPSIARGDAVALVMELAVQDEIAHQTGYSDA